jgi:predicted metalloprotease
VRWTPGGTSDDIEDRRDDSGGGGGFGGMRLGIGGTLVLGILSLIFHRNLFTLFSGAGSESVQHSVPDKARDRAEQPEVQFISFVLDDVQNTWDRVLPEAQHKPYHHAKLVLFRNSFPSPCGRANTATGPFYCPGDEKVYLDLGFFDELRQRFGALGQFAQAYVIAHEIGHHVQRLLGIEPKVRRLQERDPSEGNALSVRLELQADCFAGIWANSTQDRQIIDQVDIDSGLRAAAAVGDDRLQKMATGHVSPESFTHGTSAQRVHWFKEGLESGRLSACQTFRGIERSMKR